MNAKRDPWKIVSGSMILFEENLEIDNDFTKYLKESCC